MGLLVGLLCLNLMIIFDSGHKLSLTYTQVKQCITVTGRLQICRRGIYYPLGYVDRAGVRLLGILGNEKDSRAK